MDEERLKELDDNDIPVVEDFKTIKQWEEENGRGFWGNPTSGYIYDEDM